MNSTRLAALLAVAFLVSSVSAQAPPACQPAWQPTFGPVPGTDSPVLAMAVFDSGSGPELYIGGQFSNVCGRAIAALAKWNGSSWSAVGGGLSITPGSYPATVGALTVFDDGTGPALCVGGLFSSAGGTAANNIAKWNGSSWSALGSGVGGAPFNEIPVAALAPYDDGSGPALYAAGPFTTAGGGAASGIARWDGSSWSAVGGGTNGGIRALAVFDDGSGPALHAGGGFTSAGGVPAANIAKWNGSAWSALGSGVSGPSGYPVLSLAVYDDGSGRALYAGGMLTSAGGSAASEVAKWDGASWSALGSGVGGGINTAVWVLRVFDSGGGPELCAGGSFSIAGGAQAAGIAKWNGSSWSALGSGMQGPSPLVASLAVYDAGSGPSLYAGGAFSAAGGQQAKDIARWDGASWSGFATGFDDVVSALAVLDDGSGPALHAGGNFTNIEGVPVAYVARWDGSTWSALGSGLQTYGPTPILAFAEYDDGSGPALYACGSFTSPGGSFLDSIARWDGSTWSPVGGGLHFNVQPLYSAARALAVYDDGSGPALYVTGSFNFAGGVPVPGLARWNGTNWSAAGNGFGGGYALAVFDDGSGPALYAGGASGISRWDGTNWTWLGVSGPFQPVVYCLAVYDDGAGPALYAGGVFAQAGQVAANNVAKWNGSSWSALGSGVDGPYDIVNTLAGFDDGSGPALYAGGWISSAGGSPANGLARWNGTSWSALGPGVNSVVSALAAFDDGNGTALIAGGWFTISPAGDSFLAKWGNAAGCGAPGSVVCEPGVGGVSACPCGNPPASAGLGCNNSANTGGAQLAASGIARIAYDSVVFTTSGETPSATSIVLQGDALNGSGALFGQGVRCVAGNLKRLYVKTASGGSIRAPSASDLHVHARSAALGDTIAPGSQRFYGVYYRDPNVLGGCQPTSTFNITQQLDLLWQS